MQVDSCNINDSGWTGDFGQVTLVLCTNDLRLMFTKSEETKKYTLIIGL